MRSLLIFPVCLSAILSGGVAAEPVTFHVHARVDAQEAVFVAPFGDPDPERELVHSIRMMQVEGDQWTLSMELSVEREPSPRYYVRRTDPALLDDAANGRLLEKESATNTGVVMPPGNTLLRGVPSPAKPELFTFVPRAFPGRTVRVLLPPGYASHSDRRYPVLYALDGQNVFSPGGPYGSWDLDMVLARMMAAGEFPELIVVGVDNSDDRLQEYLPEWAEPKLEDLKDLRGRGLEHLRMIRDELMPEIDSRYRTRTGPANTMLLGSSLGGLMGFTAALEMDDVFGTIIAMSPAFWVSGGEALERAPRLWESSARLWIDSGTEGRSHDGYKDTMAVRDAVLRSGGVLGARFQHMAGPGHDHNEAAWRARLPHALRWAAQGMEPK
jgi:predicted alpha/beta superfamily hydrolase